MKKYIISLIIFIIAFAAAMVFIYFKANPVTRFSEENNLVPWHGQVDNEYGTYDGELIGDIFSGQGNFRFLSGETYAGEWTNAQMTGSGKLEFPEIGVYSGSMSDSKRNGYGVFSWDSGEIYEGEWQNDAMYGSGKYTFANGMEFEGVMENNKPISGKLSYKSDSEEIITDFVYTFSDTEKKIVFNTKDGLKYDGDISGLTADGSAEITYPSGNTYSGQVTKGKRNGTGKFVWNKKNGKVKSYYEGDWKINKMNGSGKYHYSSSEYPYLSGKFDNGVPKGTLTYYKAAGNTFETKWENGECKSVKET